MSYSRRRFLAASGALVLAGCGGGGSAQYIGGPVAAYRPGILYGYFGDDALQAADTAAHANIYMSAPWSGGVAGAIENIARAKAAGFRNLLVAPQSQLPDGLGGWRWGTVEQTLDLIYSYMAALQVGGALDDITLAGIYWCDEPNRGLTDEFVRAVNVGLRNLTSAPLWTCYSADPGRPGLDAGSDPRGAFDRVAVDDYDVGCNVLGGPQDELRQRMKPGAQRFLVAGPVGGLYQQSDPSCFENFAYANADVIAIVIFIWIDGWGNVPTNQGIRSIKPLKDAYTALGHRITGK